MFGYLNGVVALMIESHLHFPGLCVYSVAELVDTAVKKLEKPDCPGAIELYYEKPLPEAWGSEVPCNTP
jgi:hypothetical protein